VLLLAARRHVHNVDTHNEDTRNAIETPVRKTREEHRYAAKPLITHSLLYMEDIGKTAPVEVSMPET
jgi:hypothetical protein